MRRVLTLLAVTALTASPVAAAAPHAGKPVDWGFMAPVGQADALKKVHDFAGCLAVKRPNVVRTTLLLDYTSAEYRKGLNEIAQGSSCVKPGKLRMGGAIFPGALAEAAFLTDFGTKPIDQLLPADWSAKAIEAKDDMDVISYCTLQQSPGGVRALMGTEPGSAAERLALQSISAVLPSCVKAGMQVRFNNPELRALLALALFRAVNHFRSV